MGRIGPDRWDCSSGLVPGCAAAGMAGGEDFACRGNTVSVTTPGRRRAPPQGRPQGIAPTIERIGLPSLCRVGAIPCGQSISKKHNVV